MPWTITLQLDTAADAESVGTVTGTYTDDNLFAAMPFACSTRDALKGDYGGIVKRFHALLAAETTRRQVAAKVGAALEDALNAG